MQSADTLSFVIDKHMEVFAIKQLLFWGSGNFGALITGCIIDSLCLQFFMKLN